MNKLTPKLFLLVGLPASGKSTVSKDLSIKHNAKVHSSDALREELLNDVNNQKANSDIFMELHRRIKEDLKNGENVVFDSTNISYKRRMSFLQELKNIPCEKICVLIATPYEKCLEQNKMRERVVPDEVIKRMYTQLDVPAYFEGWDDIEIIYNVDKEYNVNELFNGENGLNKIEQDNPHHTLTIGKHCRKCSSYIETILYSDRDDCNLFHAGLFHDIGKRFTKQFKNYDGKPTETAHYYNHEHVSAYDVLFYLKDGWYFEDILAVAQLIRWHMQPFFMKETKTINKFINLVGQDFYDKLLILHEADRKAH